MVGRSLTKLLPGLLLLIVAAISIGRIAAVDATSWSGGGGFTMFARTDYAATRYVKMFEFVPGGEPVPVTIPTDLRGPVDSVRDVPSDANLRALGDAYLARSEVDADRVRVEVWWLDFDGTTVTPRLKADIERPSTP